MGAEGQFQFTSPEAIREEIRQLWPAGAGVSYRRLEHGGLQWPCPDEQHPGTTVLHADSFPAGKRTSLPRISFSPSPAGVSAEYPFVLITGRTLQQYNAGTMTGRTDHQMLRRTDLLDICPADAERLGIGEGDLVQVRSQYGAAVLPAHLTAMVAAGALFATFHDTSRFVNYITGPLGDQPMLTPEYKVTAVRLTKH